MTEDRRQAAGTTALLCGVFFLSGAAALLFETLWFRLAGIAFGNSVWSSSIVLASFMGGLALGNALSARHGHRVRDAVRAYAWVEVLIAVTGVGLVLLLPLLSGALAPLFRPLLDRPWLLNPLRLLVAFALMLVPATAMGVTLPLLVKALFARDPRFGSVLGKLYGWNTLGAVAGALAGEALLIERLGVRGTGYAAGLLDLLAAGGALAIAARSGAAAAPAAATPADRVPLSARAGRLLAGSFLAGGVLLALEVVWFRFLQLFVVGTNLAFAVMLATVLAGIGAGGLLGGWWSRLRPGAQAWLGATALSSGIVSVWTYAAFAPPQRLVDARPEVAWEMVRVGLVLMLPVSTLSGILFTLFGSAMQRELSLETRTAGWITLANTTGAMCGSLIAGFVLLPRLGMERSLLLLALAYGAVALCGMEWTAWRGRALYANALCAALFAASIALFPSGSMQRFLDASSFKYRERYNEKTVAVREGLLDTIQYLRKDFAGEPLNYRMMSNGFSMSGSALDSLRYMRIYVYWPVALHPDLNSALLIGFGVGNTAKALTDTAELETIDLVDISRDVLEMSRVVYSEQDNPLNDPRMRVHLEDGRYFLQTSDRRFDLITADPPPLLVGQTANLYTQEYFEAIYERLADGGFVTYWLPAGQLTDSTVRSILAGFCNAFEDCSLWAGCQYNWMMAGSRNARGGVTAEHFTRQWRDPAVAAKMAEVGFEVPEQLGATLIADATRLRELIGDAPPLEDNHPKRMSYRRPSQKDMDEYYGWMNPAITAPLFERSPLTARLWPPELREATAGYFRYQEIANMLVLPDNPYALNMIDTMLGSTPLRTAPLWLMGSSVARDRIVEKLRAAGQGAEYHHYLGARALVDGDYARAAFEFGQRPQEFPEVAEALRVYALCKQGHAENAERAARDFRSTFGKTVGYSCW